MDMDNNVIFYDICPKDHLHYMQGCANIYTCDITQILLQFCHVKFKAEF